MEAMESKWLTAQTEDDVPAIGLVPTKDGRRYPSFIELTTA
jgi:hypothetical protein